MRSHVARVANTLVRSLRVLPRNFFGNCTPGVPEGPCAVPTHGSFPRYCFVKSIDSFLSIISVSRRILVIITF